MDSAWLNTAANVFASIGTVGAFGTGFVLLRREHRREADREEESRRSQATKVSAWVEAYTKPDGTRELAFHIHNASDMPIYEAEIPLPVHPGEESVTEFIGLIPPGRTMRRSAPNEWLKSYIEPEPIQIEFDDSLGYRWSRDELGTLLRVARPVT